MFSSSDTQEERSRLLPAQPHNQNDRSLCFSACAACSNCVVEKHEDDDVVSLGIKRLCVMFSIVIGFWLLSFILIMSDVIQHERLTPQAIFQFLPMWYGSAVGIISVVMVSVHVCQNATLISKERRQYMRRQGTESQSLFIDYDSLPLMRRLFCWNIGLSITFLLILTAQILFTLWFIYDIIGLWHALIPMIILTCGYLLYLYAMNFFSLWCCGIVTLAVLQLVLFILKCNAELPGASWTVTTFLMDIVSAVSYTYLIMVCYESIRGRYALKFAQKCTLFGYLVSLALISTAVGMTVYNEYTAGSIWSEAPHGANNSTIIGTVQYILCTVAVTISTLCIIIILNMEGRTLAHTRGFRNPVPLSRYKDGWMPTSGCGDIYTILMGTIEVRAATPATIAAQANASMNSRIGAPGANSTQIGGRYGRMSPIDAIIHAQRGTTVGEISGNSNHRGGNRSSIGRKANGVGNGGVNKEDQQRDWEGEIELLVRNAGPSYDSSVV